MLVQGVSHALQAETIEPTIVYALDYKQVYDLLNREPKLALGLMKWMAERLEEAYIELEEVAYEPTYQRMCKLLIDLCDMLQVRAGIGCFIALRITQEDMAEMLGITRMTVTKAVRELRQKQILFGRSGNLRLDHDGLVRETQRLMKNE